MDIHPTTDSFVPSDRSDPYFDADHPEHAAAVQAVQTRIRAESPEPSTGSTAPSRPRGAFGPFMKAAQAKMHALIEEDATPATRTPDAESPKPTEDALAPYNPEAVELPALPAEHEWNQSGLGEFANVSKQIGLSHAQATGLIDFYAAWGPRLSNPDEVPKALAAFVREAERLGIAEDHARQLFDWHAGTLAGGEEAVPSDAALSTLHALRTEWGSQFDDRLARAKMAVRSIGGADIVEMLEETGLGNDPRVIRLFARFGESLDRERTGGADASSPVEPSTLSPEAAERLINTILDDAKSAYYDSGSPRHRATVEHVKRLYARAYPS